MATPSRTRTIRWTDPIALAEAGKAMSGLDFLNAILRGDLPPPPIAETLGYGISEVAEGRVVFTLVPGEHLYNPIGVVHGGVAATLLDTVMACAIHTRLPKGDGYTTIELHVNFTRGVTSQVPRLEAIGEVVHVGGRVATAEGRLVDAAGKIYAHATTTCLLLRA